MEALTLFDAGQAPAAVPAPSVPEAPAQAPPAQQDLFSLPPSTARPARSGAAAPSAPPSATAQRRSMTPAVLAVDGNSLAHRAFHAYGSAAITGPDGRARGPLYGFLALLAGLCDRVAPGRTVVALDCRVASRRRERCPQYKANRPDKDPALGSLLDELPSRLRELGVAAVVAAGWEADDVVGSVAAQAESAGLRCVVATSDRDAFALVSDRTTVLRLRAGLDNAVEVTPRRLAADIGVSPGQYVEYAAMRGDTSDNLPGVRGIGPSRAAALLAAFPTVAAAAADPMGCRSVLGKEPGQALLDDLAEPATSVFLRNVSLMTVRRDLDVDLDAAGRRMAPERMAATLSSWGLGALNGRMTAALAARPETAPPLGDADLPLGAR